MALHQAAVQRYMAAPVVGDIEMINQLSNSRVLVKLDCAFVASATFWQILAQQPGCFYSEDHKFSNYNKLSRASVSIFGLPSESQPRNS